MRHRLVGHRAHGAEIGLVADRAEDEGEDERPAGDVGHEQRGIGFVHAEFWRGERGSRIEVAKALIKLPD
ncbi:MAG: hypothetical protein ACXW3T_06435 [Rhodoplanes sp.]